MPQGADGQAIQIDRFFAGPGSRGDQWRSLVEIAEAGDRAKFDAALGQLAVTEAFHAYPGPQLLAALRNNKSDTPAIAALARRILRTLLTGAYRQNAGEWDRAGGRERRHGRRAAADARPRGSTPALFRGPDRHRRARDALARARHRMAPPAPPAGPVRLRAGLRRQLRGRVLRDHAQCEPRGGDHPGRLSVPLAPRRADPALADRGARPSARARTPARCASRRCSSACGPSSTSTWCRAARSRRSPEARRRRRCAACSMRWRSCSSCISRSSRACRRATRRRSSTI